MSVGKQYNFSYFDGNTGELVTLGDVQNIKIVANKHVIKSQPYNAPPRFGYIPDGYAITFTIVRTGPELENYQLSQNANFNAGENVIAGTLTEMINEADGTTRTYQYVGFVFWINDIGDITREAPVKMMAEGMASDKIQVS